jgi:hypothetical protein
LQRRIGRAKGDDDGRFAVSRTSARLSRDQKNLVPLTKKFSRRAKSARRRISRERFRARRARWCGASKNGSCSMQV